MTQGRQTTRVGRLEAGKKYASSVDVARMAGVSQSAVSRTFSGGAQRLRRHCARKFSTPRSSLDYRPSLIPRIMLTHKSNLVAIVVGGLYNPFYSAVLEQFTIKFQAAGHQVLLVHVASDHALGRCHPQACQLPRRCHRQRLGNIVANRAAATLAKLKIPVISFNTAVKNDWVTRYHATMWRPDGQSPICFVTRGARSFGFISGPSESHASAGRLKGFQREIDQLEAGPVSVVGRGDYRYEGGFAAALEMFAKQLAATGAVLRERSAGHRSDRRLAQDASACAIPEDVLVAGFDDIPAAAWASDRPDNLCPGRRGVWSRRPWLSSPPRRPANAKNLRRSSFPHG